MNISPFWKKVGRGALLCAQAMAVYSASGMCFSISVGLHRRPRPSAALPEPRPLPDTRLHFFEVKQDISYFDAALDGVQLTFANMSRLPQYPAAIRALDNQSCTDIALYAARHRHPKR